MKFFNTWLVCLIFLPLACWGQFQVIPGKTVNGIAVKNGNSLSYYVPVDYEEKCPCPVVFAFDPEGNANAAVEAFRTAAEKYGYVIISYDAIKNGSYQENYRHARDLFQKSEELFLLDSINRFAAGFSGGARLAVAIAGLSNEIKGVIASGAGLNSASENWLKNKPFVFIGLSGNGDFNYTEMKFTEGLLQQLKYPFEIIWFDGGHEWAPAEKMEKALRDLSVLMFGRNQLKFSEEELMEFYQEQLAYNKTLQNEGHWVWAYKDLEKMRDWYGIYGRDDELKDLQRDIRRNREYRTQRSELKYVEEIEPLYLQEYMAFLVEDISAGDLEALGYWEQELEQFNKSFSESKKAAERDMAVRIKAMLGLIANQAKAELQEPEAFKNLLFLHIFQTLLDKNNQEAYLETMRLAVATGDYDIALYYTDRLFAAGFKDINRLRNYPGITLLRIQPEFGEVLKKYGFESRF